MAISKLKSFTIYNPTTREVVGFAKTYRKAEKVCTALPALVFDDTCPHGTAYDLCDKKSCNMPSIPTA